MGVSSGLAMDWVEGGSMLEHGPQDGGLAVCEGNEGLGVVRPE